MTDQYDPEQGSGAHEEHAGEDAWRDDQPPVDDFADEPAHEEAATASHDVEPDMEEEAGEVRVHRKSLFLPIAAGVGGLVILGGVVFWQLSRSGLPVQPPAQPVAAVAALATPQDASDLSALYKGTSSASPNLPVEETAPTTALAMPEAAPAAATPSAGVAVPTAAKPVPVAQEPLVPNMPAAPLVAATPTTTPSAPVSSETQARLDALNARIEELSKSLNQATKQLDQLGNMVTADRVAPPTASNPASDAVVEERLAKIERGLANLQQQKTTSQAVPAASETTAPPEKVAAAEPVEPAASPPATTKKLAPSHRKAKVVSHHTAPTEHQTSSKSRWFLRAATPDEAWVSTDANSTELRHIEVGDSLPGVGRVKSIHQIDGAWVVEGSSGSVH